MTANETESAKTAFPDIGVPIYLSTGHTAHATVHTGIQRVTRSLAKELSESDIRVELIEWIQRKRRYVVLDDNARRKLSRNGGPVFESTDSLWARTLPEIHLAPPQPVPPNSANEPYPSSLDEDRILRFEAVIRSINHPIPGVPKWIGYLPLPRAGRRAIRRGIRRVLNAAVRRNDRRKIRDYIRDIVASRKLYNRTAQQMLKMLERQSDYAFRLKLKEMDVQRYKQTRDLYSVLQDPDRTRSGVADHEAPGIDQVAPPPELAGSQLDDGSAANIFSLTLRLLPTRFKPIRGAWAVVPELMKPQEMRDVVRYCRVNRLNLAVVFHDAIAVTHPELVSPDLRRDYAAFIRYLCQGDLVIAVSRQSGDELKKYADKEGITLPRVIVCPNGASFQGERPTGSEPADPPPVRAICVGTIDPRKNHATLLEALDLIRRSHPSFDLQVTLIGNAYPGAEHLAQQVTDACTNSPKLTWKQGVSDEELIEAYQNCHFSIFPSTLEGFGLPVLESIWHGRPCICSATGAVGERAQGGGCATVDVTDPDKLAGAIVRLAEDEAFRRQLTNEAKSRVLRTWRAQALDLVNALKQAVPRYQFTRNRSDTLLT